MTPYFLTHSAIYPECAQPVVSGISFDSDHLAILSSARIGIAETASQHHGAHIADDPGECGVAILSKGKELHWSNSTEMVALAVAALAGFVFFLIWVLTAKQSIANMSWCQRRNFWASVILTCAFFMVGFQSK